MTILGFGPEDSSVTVGNAIDLDFRTISIGLSNLVLIGSIFSISTRWLGPGVLGTGVPGGLADKFVMSARGSVFRCKVDEAGDSFSSVDPGLSDGAGVGSANCEFSSSVGASDLAADGSLLLREAAPPLRLDVVAVCVGLGGSIEGSSAPSACDGVILTLRLGFRATRLLRAFGVVLGLSSALRLLDAIARVGDGGITVLSSASKICDGSMLTLRRVTRLVRLARGFAAFGVASVSIAAEVRRRVVRFAALRGGAGEKTSSSEADSALTDALTALLSESSDSSTIVRRAAALRGGRDEAAAGAMFRVEMLSLMLVKMKLLTWLFAREVAACLPCFQIQTSAPVRRSKITEPIHPALQRMLGSFPLSLLACTKYRVLRVVLKKPNGLAVLAISIRSASLTPLRS